MFPHSCVAMKICLLWTAIVFSCAKNLSDIEQQTLHGPLTLLIKVRLLNPPPQKKKVWQIFSLSSLWAAEAEQQASSFKTRYKTVSIRFTFVASVSNILIKNMLSSICKWIDINCTKVFKVITDRQTKRALL